MTNISLTQPKVFSQPAKTENSYSDFSGQITVDGNKNRLSRVLTLVLILI